MSSSLPSGPQLGTQSLSRLRFKTRYQQNVDLQRAKEQEKARGATMQRVSDAEDVLKRNAFSVSDSSASRDMTVGEVHTEPTPRKTLTRSQGAVEIPGYREYSSLQDASKPGGTEHEVDAGDCDNQDERPESSTSILIPCSSPSPYVRSRTSLETITRDDTETRSSKYENNNDDPGIDPSMLADPRIQSLVNELQRVQKDQEAIQINLTEAKTEIEDLRRQVREAEDRRIQDPCNSKKSEEYQQLRSILQECQADRDNLQTRLDQAEQRELELKRQLRQAREDVDSGNDTITRLNDELLSARLERDQHAKTAEALQHQLDDARHKQPQNYESLHAETLEDTLAHLNDALHRANQDREMYARHADELQEQLQRSQHYTESFHNTGALTSYQNHVVGSRGAVRTTQKVELRNGRLCTVRRPDRSGVLSTL